MYSYLRLRSAVTWLVRIIGDQEQEGRWRAAARRAGFRPRECQDENGHPALAVSLRDHAEMASLVELMVREEVSGVLEQLS